jgi:hypothetical protein
MEKSTQISDKKKSWHPEELSANSSEQYDLFVVTPDFTQKNRIYSHIASDDVIELDITRIA